VIPFAEVAPNCHNSNKAVDPMVKIGNYITKTLTVHSVCKKVLQQGPRYVLLCNATIYQMILLYDLISAKRHFPTRRKPYLPSFENYKDQAEDILVALTKELI
jgi:triphosphoribosyl-dephospho-CoA synthetase